MKTTIINIFGGPGSGKSTTCYGVLYLLRRQGIQAEFVSEWIKDKVYEGTEYPFVDQPYTHAKQRKKIRQVLGKVPFIITDSPLPLSLIYGDGESTEFKDYVLLDFNTYNNVNFLVVRDHEFSGVGRHQTEAEADAVAASVHAMLVNTDIDFTEFATSKAVDAIVAEVVAMNIATFGR